MRTIKEFIKKCNKKYEITLLNILKSVKIKVEHKNCLINI